jgi:PAS domain S-box-containing protein
MQGPSTGGRRASMVRTMTSRDPSPSFEDSRFRPMAGTIPTQDWGATALGPRELWPSALSAAADLMTGSGSAMFVGWGPDLLLVYNDAYAAILGERHPGALGRPYRDVWPEIWGAVSGFARRTLAGEPVEMEDMPFRVVRGGREEEVAYTFSASALRDGDAVGGIFCVCSETTERVRSREALVAGEARMRGVLEGMGEGFCLLDPEFRLVRINAEGLRLDGRPCSEILGRTWWDIHPGTEAGEPGRTYRRAMSDGVPATVEYRHAFPDGRERWLEARAYPSGDGLALFYRDVSHRREREDALAEAETRLRALADNLPGGVAFQVVAPRDNAWRRFVYLSRGFEAMFGVKAEAALADAEAVYGLIPAEYRAAVDEAEARNVRELLPFDGIVPMRRPDGSLLYGRSLSAPRPLPDGTLIFDGIMLDETARVEAEARLRDSEVRFQAIADSIEQMVWSSDAAGRHDYFNQRWYDFTGAAPGSCDASGWEALLHPDDLPRARGLWAESLRTGEPYRIEYRLRHASGRHRWVMGRAQAVRDGGGAIGRWYGTCTDIQDIVEAREVLSRARGDLERQVEERTRDLDRVWRLSGDLFAVLDGDGVHLRPNPAWTEVLGLAEGSVAGSRFEDAVHPGDRAAVRTALSRLRRGETVRDLTLRLSDGNGNERWYGWTCVPEDGLVYASGRDVTARRLTEEALLQAQKMEAVGQLTGGLAHDFNNLLTGISGSLELLQLRVEQGRYENVPRYAKAAMSSANRAAALTHRLLAFARRQPLEPRAVDANRLVASMEDLVRRTIGEAIELEIATAAGLWTTLCDPHQLENALLNLAINARDALPDGGRITVETANIPIGEANNPGGVEAGDYVVVSVADTGTGMGKDVIARAFDPFFTTKPMGQGTGLGLSMIYGFASQSGGHARIESEPGSGTTVRLYLPRHAGEAAVEVPDAGAMAAAAEEGRSETILVVEDETVVRETIVEVLGELGYRVLQAADGPSGLSALLSAGPIDLLVTDVGLPGLNGRQMADQARVARPDLRVLFITGYAGDATFGQGQDDPGMQLMTKPFTVDALVARIRAMIGPSVR